MFKSELDLQLTFYDQLVKSKTVNTNILQEFNARFGNVDIVEVNFNDLNVTLTREQAEILSLYSSALVVGFLHRNTPRTYKYLISKTGYTKDYLNSILLVLEKEKIISKLQNNKYIICKDFKFPNLKFIAYELKLKDWKKAIIQASKNTNFAYKSFVVMPNDEAIKIKEKYSEMFYLYNVGLIGVTNNTNYHYISPKITKHTYSISPTFISSTAKCILKEEFQAI